MLGLICMPHEATRHLTLGTDPRVPGASTLYLGVLAPWIRGTLALEGLSLQTVQHRLVISAEHIQLHE